MVLEELDDGSGHSDVSEPATPKPRPSGLKRPSGLATPASGLRTPGSSGLRMPTSTGAKVTMRYLLIILLLYEY